ncbi:MAG TPA: type VI secretion system tip protein TssI/VgrG [Terriglobales bacterium]|nr:type VI secretion system tip protein TssI/VgrG [Terriglobales bacterium]
MGRYKQAGRPLKITTPLETDALLLVGFQAKESISQLFQFQAEMLAEAPAAIRFEQILGNTVTVELALPGEQPRYFDGLVKSFTQGARDQKFTEFRAEIVPKVWLLSKVVRSRIFQHMTVPEILEQILRPYAISLQLSANYYQRDYCVQYRESDLDFVTRLMEEEGIYYYFQHSHGKHEMVLSDNAKQHPDIPGNTTIKFEDLSGGGRDESRVISWQKTQELRSGAYALWDHCFELPGKHLEASEKTVDQVQVGDVKHRLKVGGNDELEIYDFPGGYAQRFDGVDRSGSPIPSSLQGIFEDKDRVARIRMEEEDAGAIEIRGAGTVPRFCSGYQFKLDRHFDANGAYLLKTLEHTAKVTGYRSGEDENFQYGNSFSCMPAGLPYRPARIVEKPSISGIQTATVVGTPGSEIFCDKYGRVKVQFHWDREGKLNGDSSCWLRVAQVWAGSGWGAFFWPRVGHEVVVAFEEGDPDQPIIVGSVYNAKNMPPFLLPLRKKMAGIKSATVHGAAGQNFNALVFVDEDDHEHLAIYSERHMTINTEYDTQWHCGRHKSENVPSAHLHTVGRVPNGDS